MQPARTKRSGRVWVKNLLGDACDFLQQFADGQVLGADILTLAAFQTVGSPGKAFGGLPFLLQVLVHAVQSSNEEVTHAACHVAGSEAKKFGEAIAEDAEDFMTPKDVVRLAVSMIYLSDATFNPFIYFQF